ncbi:hypothetical protein QQZ08_011725 [Neonectria magnoliae]|uniref:Uncharacterized protein n=1 Tax=Neonectria magnoliae TaxID=2732573 RepID=A0ABR1H7U9_9HYPO
MTPKPDKAVSLLHVSETDIQNPPTDKQTPLRTQKRQHSDSAPPRRKIIKPTEIVSPSEDDTDSSDTSDEDDVDSVDLSEDEDEEEEDSDDDEDNSSEEDDSDNDAESVYFRNQTIKKIITKSFQFRR